MVQDTGSGTTIVNRGHSRTDNLNLTGIADNVTTGNTESYSYTPSRRLQNGSGAYGALTDSYDGVGNRTQEVLGSTTMHDLPVLMPAAPPWLFFGERAGCATSAPAVNPSRHGSSSRAASGAPPRRRAADRA